MCPNVGNAEAAKVCYDHCISITFSTDRPPPLYLCIECANEIHREHPNQMFYDILHPMQQASLVCENKVSDDTSLVSLKEKLKRVYTCRVFLPSKRPWQRFKRRTVSSKWRHNLSKKKNLVNGQCLSHLVPPFAAYHSALGLGRGLLLLNGIWCCSIAVGRTKTPCPSVSLPSVPISTGTDPYGSASIATARGITTAVAVTISSIVRCTRSGICLLMSRYPSSNSYPILG